MAFFSASRGQVTGLLSPKLRQVRSTEASRWLQGNRVLDVGCGVADFSELLPENFVYVGLESDPAIAATARARYPWIEVICGNLEEDPHLLDKYLHAPFDCVIMTAVIEHLNNPRGFLTRLLPVLVPGGRIILTTPAPIGKFALDVGALLRLTSREAHAEHKFLLSKADLIYLLTSSGFEIEHYGRFLFGLNQLVVGKKIDNALKHPNKLRASAWSKNSKFLVTLALSLLVTAVIVILLLRLVSPDQILQLFQAPRLSYVALAFALYGLTYLFRAMRLRQFEQLVHVPLWKVFVVTSLHGFFNFVVPARLGELTLIYLLRKRHHISVGQGGAILLVTRLYDFISMSLCLLGALLPYGLGQNGIGTGILISSAGLVFLLLLTVALAANRLWQLFMRLWDHRAICSERAIRPWLQTVYTKFEEVGWVLQIADDPVFSTRLLLLSIAAWLSLFGTFWALLQAMGFQAFSLPEVVIGSTGAVLTNLLPVNAVGSWGTLEAGWTAGFAIIGMAADEGIASGFVVHLWTLLFAVTLALGSYLLSFISQTSLQPPLEEVKELEMKSPGGLD
jgi:uncharacterized protein (TIRG00374 family)